MSACWVQVCERHGRRKSVLTDVGSKPEWQHVCFHVSFNVKSVIYLNSTKYQLKVLHIFIKAIHLTQRQMLTLSQTAPAPCP